MNHHSKEKGRYDRLLLNYHTKGRMRVLLITYNEIEKDGRLQELNRLCCMLGKTFTVSTSMSIQKSYVSKDKAVFLRSGKKIDYIKFMIFCKKVMKKLNYIDLVFADNRAGIIPSFICKKIAHAKYIAYDARELYILKEMRRFRAIMGCVIEHITMKHFDVITCANNPRAEIMKKYYKLLQKPITFENIRKLEYKDLSFEECDDKFNEFFDNDYINLISTSGVLLERKADVLVNAVCRLGSEYRLIIVGYRNGSDQKVIDNILKKYPNNNITFLPWLSKSELKYIISKCDIGIVNYSKENTNSTYCASGKLYEFAFEGVPFVATSNPPLVEICDMYGIGIVDDEFENGIKHICLNYEQYKDKVKIFNTKFSVETNNKNVAKSIMNLIQDRSINE